MPVVVRKRKREPFLLYGPTGEIISRSGKLVVPVRQKLILPSRKLILPKRPEIIVPGRIVIPVGRIIIIPEEKRIVVPTEKEVRALLASPETMMLMPKSQELKNLEMALRMAKAGKNEKLIDAIEGKMIKQGIKEQKAFIKEQEKKLLKKKIA